MIFESESKATAFSLSTIDPKLREDITKTTHPRNNVESLQTYQQYILDSISDLTESRIGIDH